MVISPIKVATKSHEAPIRDHMHHQTSAIGATANILDSRARFRIEVKFYIGTARILGSR